MKNKQQAFLAALLIIALAFQWFFPSPGRYLLVLSIILSMIPPCIQILSSLRAKKLDIELPVMVTIGILIYIGHLSVAAFFMFLILLGRLFKDYILLRVEDSVRGISKYLPTTAFIKRDTVIEVKIPDIRKGDILIIKPGGRVPVDGIMLSRSASVDESVITGETRPRNKAKDDRLVGGSINLSDYAIEALAEDTSANSTLAQVRQLVENAQSKKAPLSDFTDRYAKATIAAALLLMALAYVISHSVLQALAVWIALVPVIFAIIVPVSTTIGISLLARKGILVKNAEALERITKVDMILFDKTGTLTLGEPSISSIIPAHPFSRDRVLALAASIEKYSEHHIGKAIVGLAEHDGLNLLPVTGTKIVKGKGIIGVHGKENILVGSRRFMEENGIRVERSKEKSLRTGTDEPGSAIYVGSGKKLAGAIIIEDVVRDDVKPAIRALSQKGIGLAILTGDSRKVAEKVGMELGIENVHAELLPADKLSLVKRFQDEGRKVLMIGDGINDAPALAQADVGVAMGLRGVEITLDSAQIVLLNDSIEPLPHIIESSKKIFEIIRYDLLIATGIHAITAILVFTNVIGILGSVIIHQVSSALVLLNTMRLFSLSKRARFIRSSRN